MSADLGGPVLVLAGAENLLQVLLTGPQGFAFYRQREAGTQFMRHLAPDAAEALACLNGERLGGLALVRGPGSFTGLRLVMAHGFGLAAGLGLPMAGLDYLPLLAVSAGLREPGRLLVLTHSRNAQVYARLFEISPDCAPQGLGKVQALGLDQASELIVEQAGQTRLWLLGSGLRRNFEALAPHLASCQVLPPEYDSPSPKALAQAALEASYGSSPPEPLYVRASDAEDNLAVIARQRGL